MARRTVSVIMPNYNHARYLPRAIEEIVHQTRPPDEFLILDDASTDNSVEIIESYAAQCEFIRLLRNESNAGVNEAHRRLFDSAAGDYVYAGAADDSRLPTFLERAMQMAEQDPDAGLVCGKMSVIDEADRALGEISIRRWNDALFATPSQTLTDYFEVEAPSHSLCGATLYRRDALREIGWYQNELEFWGDTFSFRAVVLKHGMCFMPETFTRWRRLAGSFSGAGRTDAKFTLDVIARAARLMRSERFRDRFPEEHVRRWERRYRRLTLWNEWLGEGTGARLTSPSFWWRALWRLPRLPRALRLAFYRPQLSDQELADQPSGDQQVV